jgi:uncharacterized protein YciI
MYFLALFKPGPAWLRDVPLDQQPFTVEHATHLRRLYNERKLFMGGPCADKSDLLSVVILEAASETEALGYLKDNAFVTQRVVEVEVHPWQVVFGPPS